LAIHEALADENEVEAAQLALQYQLVSPYTNYLVVAVRAEGEKAQDLPVLRKMPQMLAAGWGGSSSVVQERGLTPHVMFSLAPNREEMHKRRQQTKPDYFASMCNQRHTEWLRSTLQVTSYKDLLSCNLPDRVLNVLEAIAEQYDSEAPEELIVVAFLHALTLSALAGEFNRNVRRSIKKAYKTLRPDERLTRLMAEAFVDITPDDWGPRYNGENYAEQEAGSSHE
jgi:Ca-activated chloride channel homolog